LAAAGHEIACHTYTHLDCGEAAPAEIEDDVDLNGEMLTALGAGAPPRSFAFPYGDVSAAAKRVLSGRFATLRGLHRGLIGRGADFNQLPAVGIEGPAGEATAMRWVERAKAKRSWLILYTHDVAERPSAWGCTPAALQRLINRTRDLGFDIVTVAEGAARLAT
jgi:peptidoglycan/xylan/chitin deacetylase (PgdA/CDA1 family)